MINPTVKHYILSNLDEAYHALTTEVEKTRGASDAAEELQLVMSHVADMQVEGA